MIDEKCIVKRGRGNKKGQGNHNSFYANFYSEQTLLVGIRGQHLDILEFLDFLDEDVLPSEEELSLMFLNRI